MNLHPTEKQFELEFSVELRTRDPTNFRETDFLNRFDDELLDRILIDSSAKFILQFRDLDKISQEILSRMNLINNRAKWSNRPLWKIEKHNFEKKRIQKDNNYGRLTFYVISFCVFYNSFR